MIPWRGVLYVGLAVALWSTAEVVIRQIQADISPVQLAWIRFTLGAVMLLLLLPFDRPAARFKPMDRRLIFHCAWLAIPGIVINAIGWQYALKHAGAGMVATCFGASPIFVFLLSRLINGEALSFERGIGIVLGFVGLVILSLSKESELFTYLGLTFALTAAFAFSIFTVAIKRFAGEYAGLPLTACCFAFGAIYLLPIAYWDAPLGLMHGLAEHWAAVLYLSLGTTGLAYLCYFKGLEKIDATSAASIILLKPPAAALIAWYWGGEALTINLGIAIVFIVGGLYLVVLLGRRRQLRLQAILGNTQ